MNGVYRNSYIGECSRKIGECYKKKDSKIYCFINIFLAITPAKNGTIKNIKKMIISIINLVL